MYHLRRCLETAAEALADTDKGVALVRNRITAVVERNELDDARLLGHGLIHHLEDGGIDAVLDRHWGSRAEPFRGRGLGQRVLPRGNTAEGDDSRCAIEIAGVVVAHFGNRHVSGIGERKAAVAERAAVWCPVDDREHSSFDWLLGGCYRLGRCGWFRGCCQRWRSGWGLLRLGGRRLRFRLSRVEQSNFKGLPWLDRHGLLWCQLSILAGTRLDDRVVAGGQVREVQTTIIALIADVGQRQGLDFAPEGEARPAAALAVFVLHEDDQRARTRGDREIDSANFARLDVDRLGAGVQESIRQLAQGNGVGAGRNSLDPHLTGAVIGVILVIVANDDGF
jgi:hypothetical protein